MIFIKFLLLGVVLSSRLARASLTRLRRRSQNVIIGYRSASKKQADKWNAAGTPTDDGNWFSTQIGKGVYTTAMPNGRQGGANDWKCVILADSDALDRVSKAWVPETYAGTKLWYNDDQIDKYITFLEDSWDPAKTIRLSLLSGIGYDDVQLLIPPGLLNINGSAMGLVAICKATLADLPDIVVNYDDWQNNIKGSRTDPWLAS